MRKLFISTASAFVHVIKSDDRRQMSFSACVLVYSFLAKRRANPLQPPAMRWNLWVTQLTQLLDVNVRSEQFVTRYRLRAQRGL